MTTSPPRIRPRKSLGQNFLRDENIVRKILDAVAPAADDVLVEIGPGEGALTRFLAGTVRRLVAVEIDGRAVELLRTRPELAGVELVHGDFLRTDLPALAADGPVRIVGNIPYNITTPILFHVLDHRSAVRDLTIMIQQEVGARLAAPRGGGDYGILAVLTQMAADVRVLFDVSPNCFTPRPAVTSSVVQLRFLPAPRFPLADEAAFRALVRGVFGTRRKTLRNGLRRTLGADPDIRPAGIDPGRRPEELSLEEFARLSNHLVQSGHAPARPPR